MKTINIIGAGKVGKTIGRLFQKNRVLKIAAVHSPNHAIEAVDFIGAGHVVTTLAQLTPADITMVAVPDDKIEAVAQNIPYDIGIFFHLSGALKSDILQRGNRSVASVHPCMSFANPAVLVENFAGTPCSIEGDKGVLEILTPAFEVIGANVISINADKKMVYHAALVFASNYMVALVESAKKCLGYAEVDEAEMLNLLQPIMDVTLKNIFKNGSKEALTGPIARGDLSLVAQQKNALDVCDSSLGVLYQELAKSLGVNPGNSDLSPESVLISGK